MRIIVASLAVLYLSVAGCGQSSQSPPASNQQQEEGQSITGPGITGLPLRRPFRPKVTLQNSIKLAEDHLKKEKINVSMYYLSEVRMTGCGDEKNMNEPCWLIIWKHEIGAPGMEVQVTVSMNGKAAILSSFQGASKN